MKVETIEKIFNFLKKNEGKKLPKKWFDLIERLKLIKELENHPDGTQYKHEGDLELSYTNITKLPNDLYVIGDLDLGYCKQLTKLPDKLHVGYFLNIEGTNIEEIPNNLYVGNYLSLYGCTQLTKLPNNLYVGGYLYIGNTPLAKKYTNEEIREMITSKGGTIIGKII